VAADELLGLERRAEVAVSECGVPDVDYVTDDLILREIVPDREFGLRFLDAFPDVNILQQAGRLRMSSFGWDTGSDRRRHRALAIPNPPTRRASLQRFLR
jgi:hypothetical protein